MTSCQGCKFVRPTRLLGLALVFQFLSLVVADPVERASAQVLLLDIALPPMTPTQYMEAFWHDASFYKDFLKESGTAWFSLDRQASVLGFSLPLLEVFLPPA